MQSSSILSQKAALRKTMREVLRQLSAEEKKRQSNAVVEYILNKCEAFGCARHIALYLAMRHEEIDTIPLIERVLTDPSLRDRHRIYVPHIEPKCDMVFYELESFDQYTKEMNTNNKFNIKQFNDVSKLRVAPENVFDLIVVPGLAFDSDPRKEGVKCMLHYESIIQTSLKFPLSKFLK